MAKIITEFPPEVKKGQMVCFDFETFGQEQRKIHRPTGTFACISVAIEGDKNVYQLYEHTDLKKLERIIHKGTWVCHNALYDLRQFRRFATIKPRFMWDTMLADQSMQGGLYQTFGLADLSRRWLGKVMEKDVREDFSTLTEMTPAMKKYAAQDAMSTLEIALLQRATYSDDPAFKAYTVADEPMIFPVLDLKGFRIDVGAWEQMVKEFSETAQALEAELGINVMSHVQVKAKAKTLGLHLQDTSAVTLVEFADHEFIQKVIEARMYRKAVSTYGMTWLEAVESDGKVYADYHISGASTTGRFSCSDPNMQNIPQRKLPVYRSRFIASDGHVVEVSDIAQQEPCITAWHTQDAHLLQAIRNHEDLHLAVARRIFNNPSLTKEDKNERSMGKAVNLGMSYGLTPFGLAARQKLELPEAEKIINQYFRNFGGVFSWIGQQRQMGHKKGYVQTALGRRSYLNLYDRKWENNAINSPIQGGAADFMKVWARKTWEKCERQGLPHSTVAWVHDETVSDIPRDCLKETRKLQNVAFQETAELLYKGVPFSVETETGKSWAAKSLSTEQVEILDET